MSTEKSAAVEMIYVAMPYPHQIQKLDLHSEEKAVRFMWRGTVFRVSVDTFYVDECEPGVLVGSDKAILVAELLRNARAFKGVNT